jgi:exopolysaccharide production protein ExoQ
MKALDDRRFRLGFAVVALFTVLAGDAWRYSLSWYGFLAIDAVITVVSVLLIVRERRQWAFSTLPYPLLAFAALATVSITWSYYPGATALGLVTTYATIIMGFALAVALSWAELLKALGRSLRIILGLSLVFELVVSLFVRAPLLPFWPSPGVDYGNLPTPIPKLLYWSRNELFAPDGKIQGIVGNSSLLGFIALVSLIVFGLQLAAKSVSRVWGSLWLLVAVAAVACTRSATILVAIVILLAVVGVVLLLRRLTGRAHGAVYAAAIGLVALAAILISTMSAQLLALLGKSSDLTGRLDIWSTVIALAEQRPAAGWGWISFWIPWVPPFDNLVFTSGVRQLHAHNAWIDVFLQLGTIGVVVFAALALSTFVRSWQFAVERPTVSPLTTAKHTVVSLLPLLLLVALLVQSVAESRLLIEYGFALLTIIAVKTKVSQS